MQAEFAAVIARLTAAIHAILSHANEIKPLIDLVTEAVPQLHDLADQLEKAIPAPPAAPPQT